MDNLIKNKGVIAHLTNNFHQARPSIQLTTDVKQSINGTYRIVFHCIQKKMRSEHNSEEIHDSFINKEYFLLNGTKTIAKFKPSHFDLDYTENSSNSHETSASNTHYNGTGVYPYNSIHNKRHVSTDHEQHANGVSSPTAPPVSSTLSENKLSAVKQPIISSAKSYTNNGESTSANKNSSTPPASVSSSSANATTTTAKSIFVRENNKLDNKNINSNSLFMKYNANNKLPSSANATYNRTNSQPKEQTTYSKPITKVGTAQSASLNKPQSANGKQQYSKLCSIL
jgi:hypothetical protein